MKTLYIVSRPKLEANSVRTVSVMIVFGKFLIRHPRVSKSPPIKAFFCFERNF